VILCFDAVGVLTGISSALKNLTAIPEQGGHKPGKPGILRDFSKHG